MRSHFAVVAPRLSPTRSGEGFTKEREDFLKGELEWTERSWQECRGDRRGVLGPRGGGGWVRGSTDFCGVKGKKGPTSSSRRPGGGRESERKKRERGLR